MQIMVISLALVVGAVAAQSQDLLALAEGTVAFTLPFKKAYVGTNGFSARVEATFRNNRGTNTQFQMVCQSGRKLRAGMRLSEFVRSSPAVQSAIKDLGLDEIITIVD